MSKLAHLLVILLILNVQSCKKDNDSEPSPRYSEPKVIITGPILGTWNFESYNVLNGESSNAYTYHSESFNEQGFWKFNVDGTYTSEISYKETYTQKNLFPPYEESISIYNRTLTKVSGTYAFNSTKSAVILKYDGYEKIYEIEELTPSKMILNRKRDWVDRNLWFTTSGKSEEVLTLFK